MAARLERYFQYKNEVPVLYDLPVSHKCFFSCFSWLTCRTVLLKSTPSSLASCWAIFRSTSLISVWKYKEKYYYYCTSVQRCIFYFSHTRTSLGLEAHMTQDLQTHLLCWSNVTSLAARLRQPTGCWKMELLIVRGTDGLLTSPGYVRTVTCATFLLNNSTAGASGAAATSHPWNALSPLPGSRFSV